jgi:hypothetical protein
MSSIAYTVVGEDVVLFLAGNTAPADVEWRAYAQMLTGVVQRVAAKNGSIKFLVIADEGGPNAKQRSAIVDILRGVTHRTAVVSNSIIARNLITAFGWLNFSVKGFAPSALRAAAAYLDLSREQLVEVISTAVSLAPQVGGVQCLELATREGDVAQR